MEHNVNYCLRLKYTKFKSIFGDLLQSNEIS